jgi:hypothetical protein
MAYGVGWGMKTGGEISGFEGLAARKGSIVFIVFPVCRAPLPIEPNNAHELKTKAATVTSTT